MVAEAVPLAFAMFFTTVAPLGKTPPATTSVQDTTDLSNVRIRPAPATPLASLMLTGRSSVPPAVTATAGVETVRATACG
jgi:hypothetical protein